MGGGGTAAACRPSTNISGKALSLHTILLVVGRTCYTEHSLNQFIQLGLDHRRAIKLARKLHAHSVMYHTCHDANKLLTTRRAIENNNTSHSQVLEPDASSSPPGPS
eukprot:1161104-Pelagomonas_calceolata.AAC.6